MWRPGGVGWRSGGCRSNGTQPVAGWCCWLRATRCMAQPIIPDDGAAAQLYPEMRGGAAVLPALGWLYSRSLTRVARCAGGAGAAALRAVQLGGTRDAAGAGHQAAQAHGARGADRAAGRVGGVHGGRPGWVGQGARGWPGRWASMALGHAAASMALAWQEQRAQRGRARAHNRLGGQGAAQLDTPVLCLLSLHPVPCARPVWSWSRAQLQRPGVQVHQRLGILLRRGGGEPGWCAAAGPPALRAACPRWLPCNAGGPVSLCAGKAAVRCVGSQAVICVDAPTEQAPTRPWLDSSPHTALPSRAAPPPAPQSSSPTTPPPRAASTSRWRAPRPPSGCWRSWRRRRCCARRST